MAPIENFSSNAVEQNIQLRALAPTTAMDGLNWPAIVGGAIGGVALVVAIAVVAALIVRKTRHHKRAIAEIECAAAAATRIPIRPMEEASRPVSGIRCGPVVPLPQSQAGWDALSSDETLNEGERAGKRKRSSAYLPKRVRSSNALSSTRSKHLPAIMESPKRSTIQGSSASWSETSQVMEQETGSPEPISVEQAVTTDERVLHTSDSNDTHFASGDSPKPDVLPSYAIKSPSRYGAAIANDEDRLVAAPRSVSMGILDTDGAVFGHTGQMIRSAKRRQRRFHPRSISFGPPLGHPPAGPLPALPVIPPMQDFSKYKLRNENGVREGFSISGVSPSSSANSADSSVLISPPILKMHPDNKPLTSPTVEEVVADDDRAELKTVANRQWLNPRISGPRANVSPPTEKIHSSIRGNIVRSNSDSPVSRQLSTASTDSSDTTTRNRLSIPQIGTADRVSISRISSTNSLYGLAGGIQKITTPARRPSQRRSHVSASGSPRERKRRSSMVLREIANSVNQVTPQRQLSTSTQCSSRSSNGNPFQWDCGSSAATTITPASPPAVLKPSALKGSPNARKGNHRQNFVRISTLSPQILGPSRDRSSSSAGISLDEIVEERESDELTRESDEHCEVERVVAHERTRSIPRFPYSNFSNESSLRIQTLRASLTASSPTLSSSNAYREGQGLAPQHSGSDLFASPYLQAGSRQSDNQRSPFVIPKFPSPRKARASIAPSQIDTAPMPDFSLDVDSPILESDLEDGGEHSSPFTLDVLEEPVPISPRDESPTGFSPVSPVDVPSSPPLPISKTKEYDPTWPMIRLPAPKVEYDPTSPPVIWDAEDAMQERERSSFFLPFAVDEFDCEVLSPKSRPTSYVTPSSKQVEELLLSLESIPKGFKPDASVTQENLTSENVSPIIARWPERARPSSNILDLSNIPDLQPPVHSGSDIYLRRRANSNNLRINTARAPNLPTIPQSPSVPSPAISRRTAQRNKTPTPQGPRAEPARSVLKNAKALRRMNSEHNDLHNRESRNYVHLDREPSPLLPYIGSADDENESTNDLLNLIFGPDKENHEPDALGGIVLDELDFAELERNIEGVLAGFDAPRHFGMQGPSVKRDRGKRQASVWGDGDRHFDQARPKSLEFAQFQLAQTTNTSTKTIDPKLLPSTPTKARLAESSPMAGGMTPRSLYDADGFLKTNV